MRERQSERNIAPRSWEAVAVSSPTRVLAIGLSPDFGGIESFLLNACHGLDKKMVQMDLAAYSDTVPREGEFREVAHDVVRLPSKSSPLRYYRGLEAVMARGYDVIHINKNSPVDFLPVLAASKTGARVIVHAHNSAPSVGGVPGMLASLGRSYINAHADVRLACSKVAGEWLFGKGSDFTFVPNGIDLESYAFDPATRDEARKELGLAGRLAIGCVGRFTPQKNQAFLVGVLEALVGRGADAVMMFLGDGPERQAVEGAFAQTGLSGRAMFLGAVEGVHRYLQALDAVVMPSLYEGLPLVAIEAQAAGLPLVVSDTVTEEIDCTPLVHRLSLVDDPADAWAGALMSAIDSARETPHTEELGVFDARKTARLLEDLYTEASGGRVA